jgi:four helix bundle protein
VAANIAEGCGRGGDTELVRFLHIAMGSATEVEYQLLLAHDLGFVDASRYESLDRDAHEIRRMLASLMQSLKTGD